MLLVRRALKKAQALNNVEAAEAIGAVKESTVRRWRAGDIRPLRKRVRTALERYVAGMARPVSDPEAALQAVRFIVEGASGGTGAGRFADAVADRVVERLRAAMERLDVGALARARAPRSEGPPDPDGPRP